MTASILKPASVVGIWHDKHSVPHLQNALVFQRGCIMSKGAKIPLSIIYDSNENLEEMCPNRFLLDPGHTAGVQDYNFKAKESQKQCYKIHEVNPLGSSSGL